MRGISIRVRIIAAIIDLSIDLFRVNALGVGLTIGGIFLAPFTAGVSLGLTISGVTVGPSY